MLKLNGFIGLCVLAFSAGTANADIIIDNQLIPSADITSISITPANGDLSILTTPGYTITKVVAGDNVAITSFNVTPTTIVAGGSANLSWATANATACTATNGVGAWAGSVGTSGNMSVTTTTLGTYTFTLTCTGPVGAPAVSTRTLTVNSASAVSITSFTTSKSTMTEGGTTTLSWTTQNAVSCTATGGSGGWSGSSIGLPNGSVNVAIPTAGSYSFTLTCNDASAGTAVKTVVVVVSQATQECATPTLSGTVTDWKSFWLVDFPKPGYDNRYATVPRYGYLALEFKTGSIVSNGKLYTVETTVTDGVRLGAISQCPGDFDVAPECDYIWGIGGGLAWATNGTLGCQLAPNTTYYFNLTFTDGVNASPSSCSSAPCITTVQHVNR